MNLPDAFIHSTSSLLGAEEFDKLRKALEEEASISIRLNGRKLTGRNLSPDLEKSENIPWCKEGYYLKERPAFTFDPAFHAGTYYVQEASSMFLEQAVNQYITGAVTALDLCAAPGGKSTHLRSLLPEGSLLVSNEVIRSRSVILAENLAKWGDPACVVTQNDPRDFAGLPAFFDLIVTDVPCSGEGMFRKDPAAIREWSPENVEICRKRQQRIITECWKALKPGGILIYSTCTYNTRENEENIAWICRDFDATVLPVNIPENWNITGNLWNQEFPLYRFLPHRTRGEGFFMAVIQKQNTEEETEKRSPEKRDKKRQPAEKIPSELSGWIQSPENYKLESKNEIITAFPAALHAKLLSLTSALNVIQAGVAIAEVKGKNIIPRHALVMSTLFNEKAFPSYELTYREALSYLCSEALLLPPDIPRGYIILTWKGIPLGFAKNIGNRANNLYPQEWRIRSGYLPETENSIFHETEVK
ncbi:MAG: rRNA cytosine-C5-methyltransferase [Bacteroides sp.]|nr:rRNA cytosine-C5-methyltransferase [Bacteroides sp.]